MKKYILYTITSLLLTFITHAQAPRAWYASAGISQTELKSDDLLADPGLGYKLGLVFTMGYHENYNYQIEFGYNHRTFNLKSLESDFQTVSDVKYYSGTLDLGAYFNYYIIKPDQDTFFVGPQAGFNIGFLGEFTPSMSEDVSNEIYLPYLLDEDSFMNMPQVNYDLGFGLTGGYNDFKFDLRYTLGMNNRLSGVQTDSYDENHNYTGKELEGKLNSVSLNISYAFLKRIKKRK
ncbi:MAG TPA: outer membrane beta-barrel protein [Flavobacterium sp.]|uniref:outer membrane beta-barrel protein n=1 Tax=Flavobacterium sp. TaxID=239 RepID=UPI002CC43C26|nr:outer membrane beta-barrel protein [Flavobacterium sp.]HSD14174.1 outer membrane beta-barrel protein [Flavobacterium sp.]